MIKGYAVNQKRLEYLEKTVKLIDIAGRIDINLKGIEAQEIIKVINNYSNALNLLDDYDHKRIIKPNGTINENKINYEACMNIVNKLKFSSNSDLFALERNEGLKEIIGAIYQYIIGLKKLDTRDKGFGLIIASVTLIVICQVLPLVFAIVVKGWRG